MKIRSIDCKRAGPKAWFRRIARPAVLAGVLVGAVATGHAAQQLLSGHVPAAVSRLQPLATLPPTNQMRLAISLPLRNADALGNFLGQLYNPSSPSYRKYLSPEQFTEQFGPTEQDYEAVKAFATAHGLTIVGTHSNRLVLDVAGPVSAVQDALHVTLHTYQHPTEDRTFYAPDSEPSVDLPVRILRVNGLNDYFQPKPAFHRRSQTRASSREPMFGQGPGGTYAGSDFRKAYLPGYTPNGSGQLAGLFELDGYFPSDITTYEQMFNLPNVPLVNVNVDGFSGPAFVDGVIECSLDIEMIIAMAPGVSQIVVYQGNNTGNDSIITDMLNQIAANPNVKQISSSWLIGDNPAWDPIYQEFAAQGQSFFQASGDDGGFNWKAAGQQKTDDPNITLVGGTTLTTSFSGAWKSETTWNWWVEFPGEADQGATNASGGGISPNYPLPSYQSNVNMTVPNGSQTNRNIPDVALTADNIYVFALGSDLNVGGTSAAAPLWVGFTAMINQLAFRHSLPAVGFLNPAIYNIGLSGTYTNDFHDITTGNNTNGFNPISWAATNGYDLCTGWGTPTGAYLISAIAGVPPGFGLLQLTFDPPSGSTLISTSAQPIQVAVSDLIAIQNAKVTGMIAGSSNLTFLDNGKSPDSAANDGTYTALLQVPASGNSITLTVTATVTNELGATNVLTYYIVSPPSNDNFVNAIKVPSSGGTYLSNNRFATVESGEPQHVGTTNVAASLWWTWVASANTNVLIDMSGSSIQAALAVYTGTSVSTLTVVASTNVASSKQAAYLKFNVTAGTAYRIAVASVSTNSVGSVRLAIVPGGQHDTAAPAVFVDDPLTGSWVTNSVVSISGTALELQPDSPGLSQVVLNVDNGYDLIASGTTNWSSTILLSPGLNTVNVTATDLAGNSATTTAQINYVIPGPPNDYFANAIVLTNNSGTSTVNTASATKEFGEPNPAGNSGGKSVWWAFTPTTDGLLTLSTTNSSFDTVMALYTGPDVADLTVVAANDDAYPGVPGGFSRIDQAVRSNVTYHVVVDGFSGVSGTAKLIYSFNPTAVFQMVATAGPNGSVQISSTNGLGGVSEAQGLTEDFASGSTAVLTAMPDPYYSLGGWSGSVTSTANPLAIVMTGDMSVTANFVGAPFTDDFESGTLTNLAWNTFGNAPWFVESSVVASGQFAAQSGPIGNAQISTLQLTTNFTNGAASFAYKVSSETNFDYLRFTVDGVQFGKWSGEVGWANFTFFVISGTHTLEWDYVKDPSISKGLDAGFIDNVNLPLVAGSSNNNRPPVTSASAAHLALVSQSGNLTLNLHGQTNQIYIVQQSGDLLHWQPISTNTATSGTVQISVSSANAVIFYRAVVAP